MHLLRGDSPRGAKRLPPGPTGHTPLTKAPSWDSLDGMDGDDD
eukprot:gene4590-1540_t